MNLIPMWMRESKAAPMPSGGNSYVSLLPSIDQIAHLKTRSEKQLLLLYRDTAYYCANLNARGVAKTPLYVYRKSGTGKPVGPQGRRLTKSKSSDRDTRFRLKSSGYISDDDEVEEIMDHPFLELLEKPFQQDGIGMMGRFTLLEVTQLFLEVYGRAYWTMQLSPLGGGAPIQIFPLTADNVEEYRENNSDKFVDYYKYQSAKGMVNIPFNEVVPFRCPSLLDPITGGYSPMQAASDRVGVNLSFMAQTQALLNNRSRPDYIIAPKGPDQGIGKAQARRWTAYFKQAFRGALQGIPWFAEEAVDVHALTFNPKDMGELAEDENTVKQICRIFDVPLSMTDKDANRASAEEGRKQHADSAICPRHARLEQAINANIMPRYDASGRTFVKFDEPYKAPLTIEAKDIGAIVNVVLTPDELRELLGYGPMPEEHKTEMERLRKEEMDAKKPPMKPVKDMTPLERSAFTFNRVKEAALNGKCRH